jgi:hypothetical protein
MLESFEVEASRTLQETRWITDRKGLRNFAGSWANNLLVRLAMAKRSTECAEDDARF